MRRKGPTRHIEPISRHQALSLGGVSTRRSGTSSNSIATANGSMTSSVHAMPVRTSPDPGVSNIS